VEGHKIHTFAGHQAINRTVLSLSLLATTESRIEIFLLCVTIPLVGKTEVDFLRNSSIYPATHPNKTQRGMRDESIRWKFHIFHICNWYRENWISSQSLRVRMLAKMHLNYTSTQKCSVIQSVDWLTYLPCDGDLPAQNLYRTNVVTFACSTTTADCLVQWRLKAPDSLQSQTVHKHIEMCVNSWHCT